MPFLVFLNRQRLRLVLGRSGFSVPSAADAGEDEPPPDEDGLVDADNMLLADQGGIDLFDNQQLGTENG